MALQNMTEINLDISQPGLSVVHAKQYDTLRKVKVHLFDSGIWWMAPEQNYVAVVAYKKADRVGGFYDHTEEGELAVSVDGTNRSIAYIALDRQTLTTSGNVNVELTFYDSITTGRLSTFSFVVDVEAASLDELDLQSNPYFNVLADDIAAVLQAEANMTGVTASAVSVTGGVADVDVTGGQGGTPYNFEFEIPVGNVEIKYAVNTSTQTRPSSGWVSDITSLSVPAENGVIWTRVKYSFTGKNGSTISNTWYSCAKQGYVGPPGVSVSTTDPAASDSNVLVWINPDDGQIITIPDATECNPTHFSGTISSFPHTITDNRITTQMRVINCEFGSPENITSDVSWNTDTAGRLVLNGTLKNNTTTTYDLDLQICVVTS